MSSDNNTIKDVESGHTRKRQVRNEVERRRKDKINGWILRIAELLPETIPEKQSKNKILEQAVEYIKYLSETKEKLLLENSCEVQAEEIRTLKKRIRHLEEENANYLRLLKTTKTPKSAFPKKLWEAPGKYSNKISTEQADALLQSFEHKSVGDSQCHSKLEHQANSRSDKSGLKLAQTQSKRVSMSESQLLSEDECDASVSDNEASEINSITAIQESLNVSSNTERNSHNVPTSECTEVVMCETTFSDTSHKVTSSVSTQNDCSSPCSKSGDSQGNTFSHASVFVSKFSTSLGVGGVTQALPQIPVMSTCQNFSVVQNYNQKSQQLSSAKQSSCSTTVSTSFGHTTNEQSVGYKPPNTTPVTQAVSTFNVIEFTESPPTVTTSCISKVEQSNSVKQPFAENSTNIPNTSTTVVLPNTTVQNSPSELNVANVGQMKNGVISLMPNGTVLQKENKIIQSPNVMSYQLVAQQPISVMTPKESLNISSDVQLSSQITENVFVVRFLSQPSSIIPSHFHTINAPNNYSIFANNAVCHPVINNGVIVEKPLIINTGNNALMTAVESMQPSQSFPSALLLPGGQIIPVVSKATLMNSQPSVPNNILVAAPDLQGKHQMVNSQEITVPSLPVTNIPASLNLPCTTSNRIVVTSSGSSTCEQITSVDPLQMAHMPNVSITSKDCECTVPGLVSGTSTTTQSTVNNICGTKRPQEKESSNIMTTNPIHGLPVSSSENKSPNGNLCSISTNHSTNNVHKSQPHSKKQCMNDRAKQTSLPVQKGSRKSAQRPLKPKCVTTNIASLPSSNVNEQTSYLPSSQVSEQVPSSKNLTVKHTFSSLATAVSSVSSDLANPSAIAIASNLSTTDTLLSTKPSNDILAKATRSIFSNSTSDLSPSLSSLPDHDESLSCGNRNRENNIQTAAYLNKESGEAAENSKENLSEIMQSQGTNNSLDLETPVTVPQVAKDTSPTSQHVSEKSASTSTNQPSEVKSYLPYSNGNNISCNSVSQDKAIDRNRKTNISSDSSEPQPKKVKINNFSGKNFTCDINAEAMQCNNNNDNNNNEESIEAPEHARFVNCTESSNQNTVTVSTTKTATCLQQDVHLNESSITVSTTPANTILPREIDNKKESASVSGTVSLPLQSIDHQPHILRDNSTVSNVCNSNEHGGVTSHEISNLFLTGITDGTSNVQGTTNCDISFLTLSPAETFDSSLSSKDAPEANFTSTSLLDNSESTCNQVAGNCQSGKFKQFPPPHELKELSTNKNEKNSNESLSKSENSVISLNNVILPSTSTSTSCATAGIHLSNHLSSPTARFSSGLSKPDGAQSEGVHQAHCKEKEGVNVSSTICTTVSEFSPALSQVNHNVSGPVSSSDGKSSCLPCTSPAISGSMYNFSSPNLVADLTLQLSKHMSTSNFIHPKPPNANLPILSSSAPPENQRYFEYSTVQQSSKHMEKSTFPQKSPTYAGSVPRPSLNSVLPALPCSDYSTNALINSQSFNEPSIPPSGVQGNHLTPARSEAVSKQCETENHLFTVSLTTCAVLNRPSIYSAENLIQTQSTNHKKDREEIPNSSFPNAVGSKDGRQFSSVYILGNNSALPSSEKINDTTSQCVPLLMTPPSLGSSSFTSYVNSNPSVHVSNIAFSMHNGVQPISCAPNLLNCHNSSSSSNLTKDSVANSQDTTHLSVRNQVHSVIDDQLKLPRTYPNICGGTGEISSHTTSSSLHQSKVNLSASQPSHLSQSNSMCFQHLPHNDVSSRIPPQNTHFGHERSTSICVSSVSDPAFSLFSSVQPFQPEGPRSQKNINRTAVSTSFPENNSNIFMNNMVQEIGTNLNQGIKSSIQEQNLQPHGSVSNQNRSNSNKMNKSKKDKQNVNNEEIVAAPPPAVFSGGRNPVMASYFPFHDVPTCKNDSIHNSTHCFSTCQRPFVVSAAPSIHKQPTMAAAGIVAPNPDIAANPRHNPSCCPRSDTLNLGFQTPSFNVNTLHRVPTTTAAQPPPPPTCSALASQISSHNSSSAPRPVPNFNLSNIFPDINTSTDVISLPPMKFHPPSHIFPPTPQLRSQPPSLQSSSSHHSTHQNCGLYPAQPHPPVIHNSFNSIIGPTPHGFDTRSPVQMTGGVAQTVGPHPSSFGPTHTPSFGNVLHTLNFSMQDR